MSYLQCLEGEVDIPLNESRDSISTPVVYIYYYYIDV